MRAAKLVPALSLLLVCSVAGCVGVTGKTLGQNIDDATVTAAVKAKLAEEAWSNLVRIGVDTNQGVVYLVGTVPDEASKQRAAELARQVQGVRAVVNNLQLPSVGAAPAPAAPAPAPPAPAAAAPAPAGCPPVGPPSARRVEGPIENLDAGARHLEVGGVRLDLAPETTVLVNCNPAPVTELRAGTRVKAGYEVRDGRNVATVVEVQAP